MTHSRIEVPERESSLAAGPDPHVEVLRVLEQKRKLGPRMFGGMVAGLVLGMICVPFNVSIADRLVSLAQSLGVPHASERDFGLNLLFALVLLPMAIPYGLAFALGARWYRSNLMAEAREVSRPGLLCPLLIDLVAQNSVRWLPEARDNMLEGVNNILAGASPLELGEREIFAMRAACLAWASGLSPRQGEIAFMRQCMQILLQGGSAEWLKVTDRLEWRFDLDLADCAREVGRVLRAEQAAQEMAQTSLRPSGREQAESDPQTSLRAAMPDQRAPRAAESEVHPDPSVRVNGGDA